MLYRQVTKMPLGSHETTLMLERLDDLRSIRMRCLDTGTYADWRLTEAQSNTFVEAELGMEPIGLSQPGLRRRPRDGVLPPLAPAVHRRPEGRRGGGTTR